MSHDSSVPPTLKLVGLEASAKDVISPLPKSCTKIAPSALFPASTPLPE